ncbi:MAG TPA: hypothetical protein VF290_19400 [Pyrinomonadaceae bacterium]
MNMDQAHRSAPRQHANRARLCLADSTNDGRLGAIWLDGRNMKGMKDDHDEGKPLPVSMTLRYATTGQSSASHPKFVWPARMPVNGRLKTLSKKACQVPQRTAIVSQLNAVAAQCL